MRRIACVLAFLPGVLWAQAADEDPDVLTPGHEAVSGSNFAVEKAELLQILKKDIEPSLLPADAKRIRRNIMRLGSFNHQWSKEAEDFLIANAPLAELFLYDYARIKNTRLNLRILETLLRFPSYQYPRAAQIFADEFTRDAQALNVYLRLIQNIVQKHPEVFHDYAQWVLGPEARKVEFASKLDFLRTACRAGADFPLDLRTQIDQWAERDQNLWSQIFLEEVRICLKGL